MELSISYTHLCGISAAVVNFNRLPEFPTAVGRRIGLATFLHFFDDQDTLDFEDRILGSRGTQGGGTDLKARRFIGKFYDVFGRPFKKARHRPLSAKQIHWALLTTLNRSAKARSLLNLGRVN